MEKKWSCQVSLVHGVDRHEEQIEPPDILVHSVDTHREEIEPLG